MTIATYFKKPAAKRVLRLEVLRSGKTYFMSDSTYATGAADTPANMLYSNVISGMPDFRRTLNRPLEGGASTSFGTIELSNTSAAYATSSTQGVEVMVLPRGTPVEVRLAAPIDLFPAADAITLVRGQISGVGGSSRGGLKIDIVDSTQQIRSRPLTIDTAVGPMTFGYVRNMEPFVYNGGSLIYSVHNGRVYDIVQVYDDGVPVSFTKDLTNGRFTLAASPVGKVTADVKGAYDGTTWWSTTEQVIGRALTVAGVTGITQTYTSLPTGVIGISIRESTTLGEVLDKLTSGMAGYWLVDRDGEMIVAQYPLPASGTVFDENSLLSEVEWAEWDKLYGTVHFRYRRNWTKYQAKPAATADMATFAASDGLAGSVSVTPVSEYIYEESPILETYFDELTDAQAVANRIKALYGVPRKELTTVVPYTETLQVGSTITLEFDGQSYNAAVVEVSDTFNGTYPSQAIKAVS